MKFDSQYFLASTFMRIQEFYESPFPNIRGKAFTVFDYMDTEARNNGQFDYFTKWGGFNFPGEVLKKFLKTQKVLYYKNEALKFVYIKCLVNWNEPFYVIGTYSSKDLDHELAHAFYYLSKSYRQEMNSIIDSIPAKHSQKICKWLQDMGYTNEVFKDEIQAYLSTERNPFDYVSPKIINKFKENFLIMKDILEE